MAASSAPSAPLIAGLHQLVGFPQHRARLLDDLFSHRGQQHLPVVPLDEGDAQVFLELLDLRGQRRLRHVTGFRRPTEMAMFGHGHQIGEIS